MKPPGKSGSIIGTTNILSRILRDAIGDDQRYWTLAKQLFEPLSMTTAVLETDSGTPASSLVWASGRDWRFGQLYRRWALERAKLLLPHWVKHANAITRFQGRLRSLLVAEPTQRTARLTQQQLFSEGYQGQLLLVAPPSCCCTTGANPKKARL